MRGFTPYPSPDYDLAMKKQKHKRTKPVTSPSKIKSGRRLTKADLEQVIGGGGGRNETHTQTPNG
jgi:hypothetical protein